MPRTRFLKGHELDALVIGIDEPSPASVDTER
jgi:hypothetical protein